MRSNVNGKDVSLVANIGTKFIQGQQVLCSLYLCKKAGPANPMTQEGKGMPVDSLTQKKGPLEPVGFTRIQTMGKSGSFSLTEVRIPLVKHFIKKKTLHG